MARRTFVAVEGEFYDPQYLRTRDSVKEVRWYDDLEVGRKYVLKEASGKELYRFTVVAKPSRRRGVTSVKIQREGGTAQVVPVTALGFLTGVKSRYVETVE